VLAFKKARGDEGVKPPPLY